MKSGFYAQIYLSVMKKETVLTAHRYGDFLSRHSNLEPAQSTHLIAAKSTKTKEYRELIYRYRADYL
jgi:hypothetical protein